ncbi:cytochrome P450 [Tuwongella immobilis]|uniref:Cytochrome P450 n=1 Tax=Tuwongella immobilis TaxID=692036 RepID=A0A6C2YJT1_9BACT|nr:cytochrome P450 [Tuwongella immobilis]VIP01676.1 cytochrome p450 : Cytochrome P450 family protein OS=Hyphomicrobium denitrificans 1NES1 GN=HYPDE_29763 PE=3 SV=1: p450 [Tuwongella immobilis]VTR99116.1 cytochrome p450 : Cytochrome P450 family protein OS=Hyphomicrobium denitrificans 1NES1 GN=HYPDE_29763 PE=3 SV=1: p450 [Tuwongella immobilis]
MTLRKSLPPGPSKRSLAGSLPEFMTERLDFLTRMRHEFGPICQYRFGPKRIWMVSDPDLIETVLVTEYKNVIKHFGARHYLPALGNGLVLSEGEFWLRQRRLSQPAFSRQRIHSYAQTMVDLSEKLLATWYHTKPVDIHAEMSNLTSDIALKTLFDLDALEDRSSFTTQLHDLFALLSQRFRQIIKLPLWMPLPSHRRIRAAQGRLDALVRGFIERGRRRTAPGDDLLSALLQATDDDGSSMSEQQLLDEMKTLYLAGHETTALTLSWTWYLLAQYPNVEDRLADEWKRVLQKRNPTPEDLPNLPYTEAVLTESMRLYPPVYLLGRETIRPIELGGYAVPKGTTIFMSQWVMHRDERYFESPLSFRPERWLDGLAKRIPKYAYFPFGGGPRICIGNHFAQMEAALLLATIGQRYQFTHDDAMPVEPWPSITLIPNGGIHTTLKRR